MLLERELDVDFNKYFNIINNANITRVHSRAGVGQVNWIVFLFVNHFKR